MSEVFHPHRPIMEACFRAVEDRKILGGRSVSIFETAVADLVTGDVPATEDFGDGFWGTETLFVQPVEGVGAGGRYYVCDFFDPEVFGGAF